MCYKTPLILEIRIHDLARDISNTSLRHGKPKAVLYFSSSFMLFPHHVYFRFDKWIFYIFHGGEGIIKYMHTHKHKYAYVCMNVLCMYNMYISTQSHINMYISQNFSCAIYLLCHHVFNKYGWNSSKK